MINTSIYPSFDITNSGSYNSLSYNLSHHNRLSRDIGRMWMCQWAVSGECSAGASFQLFLGGGAKIFFFNATYTGLLKNWKKQHFIGSNLVLFIVPFFLSFFFSFFSLFSFFSFFFSFFSFPWGGDGPPAPLKWRPWCSVLCNRLPANLIDRARR